MPPAHARAAGFGHLDALGRRFKAAGFSNAPESTGDADLDSALGNAAALENRLLQVRTSLVRAGVKSMRANGTPLPSDAVESYNQLRRRSAVAIAGLIERLIAEVEAIPFIGAGKARELRAAVGSPQDTILQRVPLLPREVVPADYRSSSAPSLTPAEASFAGWQVPVAWGIVILLAGVGVWISARGIAAAFNTQAGTLNAEADRLDAWGKAQVELVDRLAAAGATPEQIVAALGQNKPPPPPESPIGLGAVLLGVLAAAGVGAGLYFYAGKR